MFEALKDRQFHNPRPQEDLHLDAIVILKNTTKWQAFLPLFSKTSGIHVDI